MGDLGDSVGRGGSAAPPGGFQRSAVCHRLGLSPLDPHFEHRSYTNSNHCVLRCHSRSDLSRVLVKVAEGRVPVLTWWGKIVEHDRLPNDQTAFSAKSALLPITEKYTIQTNMG